MVKNIIIIINGKEVIILIDIELINNLRTSSNILSRYSGEDGSIKNNINRKIGTINLDTRDNNKLKLMNRLNSIKTQITELESILNSMFSNTRSAINEISNMDK